MEYWKKTPTPVLYNFFIRKSSTVHLRNSQLHSAKAEGLGFKDSGGQVKRPSKPFLESLDPGPLESLRQHRPLN